MGSAVQICIRDVLEEYMMSHQLNISAFSALSGVNPGTLSRILQGIKPISLRQLEAITAAMDKPADTFFELYVEECFTFTPSMRRIRPFIMKCAELHRLDCIEQVVSRLMEDLSHGPALFGIAEMLYVNRSFTAATILYEHVANAERYQHAERLALCKYRLFSMALGSDLSTNYQAALMFEPYLNRLDVADLLEALKELIDVMVTVHQWQRVGELARTLTQTAEAQYAKSFTERSFVHPVYFYILYGWLIQGAAYAEHQNYEDAICCVDRYRNISWIKESDREAEERIQQFQQWADANLLLYRVLSGEKQAVDEYADYIASFPKEIFLALCHMLQAANRFSFNIDDKLIEFAEYIPTSAEHTKKLDNYNNSVMTEKTAQFYCDLAIYQFQRHPWDAINSLLNGMELSLRISSGHNTARFMALFEQNRHLANKSELQKFNNMSKEMTQLNADKISVILA